MNKLLIGLLIVAAGAGAYLLLKKNNSHHIKAVEETAILGKWKISAHETNDSSGLSARYDFLDNGKLLVFENDSTMVADTIPYHWQKDHVLVINDVKGDSTGKEFTILKLNADSLTIQDRSTDTLTFLRMK
jgi:hypothetical protein